MQIYCLSNVKESYLKYFSSHAWISIQQIKACNAPYLCLAQTHCLTKNCTPWYISSTELLNKYKTLMPPLIISSHIVDKFIIAIVCNLLLVLNIWILTFHGFIKLICIILWSIVYRGYQLDICWLQYQKSGLLKMSLLTLQQHLLGNAMLIEIFVEFSSPFVIDLCSGIYFYF